MAGKIHGWQIGEQKSEGVKGAYVEKDGEGAKAKIK